MADKPPRAFDQFGRGDIAHPEWRKTMPNTDENSTPIILKMTANGSFWPPSLVDDKVCYHHVIVYQTEW